MAEIHGIKGSGLASQLQCCIIVGAGESGAVLAFMELLPSPPGSGWVFDKQNSSAPGAWGEQSFESRACPPSRDAGLGSLLSPAVWVFGINSSSGSEAAGRGEIGSAAPRRASEHSQAQQLGFTKPKRGFSSPPFLPQLSPRRSQK